MNKCKIAGSLLITLFLVFCSTVYCSTFNKQEDYEYPPKPVINYFISDKQSIKLGESIRLSWSVMDAERVNIQPGINDISANGSKTVNPVSDTAYVLNAYNSSGETTSRLIIEVQTADKAENSCFSVGCDPVSGRNADITFLWEQLSLCTEYTLQIAKDPNFTLLVFNRAQYVPKTSTSPGLIYFSDGVLECGHTYYIRVRCTAGTTGQHVLSPWSTLGCFTVKAGFPASE